MEDDENNDSGDYTRFGIPDVPKTTVTTAIGKTRTWAGLQWREKLFLLVSLVNILATIGLTLYRLIVVAKENPAEEDLIFTILIIVNAVFVAFYSFHGVLRERRYELYVQILAIVIILVYCITEYSVNTSNRNTVKLVRLIIACVVAPPNIYLAWTVAQEFGELEFRIAGASEHLQNCYKNAEIFSCWLKFDLQVSVSLVILVLRSGTNIGTLETVILAVGIPYTLAWDVFGWFMLRMELKWAVPVFVISGFAKPAYYVFKFVKVYHDITTQATMMVYIVIVAGALAMLAWLFLMYELIFVYRNFDQGLKERGKMNLRGIH